MLKLTALAEIVRTFEPDRDLQALEVIDGMLDDMLTAGVVAECRFGYTATSRLGLIRYLDLTAADAICPIERGLLDLREAVCLVEATG